MLVALKDPLYCTENIFCYCNDPALILTDTNNPLKIYYTCNNEPSCGYFILTKGLKLCDECNVYFYKQCLNHGCSLSSVWKYNANDNYIFP